MYSVFLCEQTGAISFCCKQGRTASRRTPNPLDQPNPPHRPILLVSPPYQLFHHAPNLYFLCLEYLPPFLDP